MSVTEDDTTRRPPVTRRGIRTRQSLIDAARVVFERDGYIDSRLTDITAEAQCSTGSFYTYFTGKEDAFAAVLEAAKEDMMHPGMARIETNDDPAAIIDASNRAYLESYRRNAKLMELLEQVANIDPAFREIRRARSAVFVKRNAKGIKDLQDRGLADPDLDPMMASRALSGMLSRLAFNAFVLKDKGTFEELAFTATRVWCNALRIDHPSRAAG
ncbi:TetR/AcrR family transcriptional regulator [Aeromicrobium sp. CTD01-1L150]|uniref:TetR/AcrR family transcriptional regulator n=1 Tax=Aeromicrobium sp. CTD01-1L150 TaxID=3341830 RepID=UPI0035C03EF3